jgi:hypothetical protein
MWSTFIEISKMERKIKCPCCDSVLVVTHQERYQDLTEHCSQPNALPSMKDGYQCPNTECIASICDVTWIEDGDYFTGKRPEGITRKELTDALEKKYGTSFAVDSWNFHYELGKQAIKRKTWKINLHWYKFVFSPKEKGWDYELEERHQPNMWKWKVEIWKKTDDHYYTNVIPFWRMTAFNMKQFRNAYKNWKENGAKSSLKSAYCTAHSLEEWRMSKDTRFYSKLSSFLIQVFQPNKVKELNNAMLTDGTNS